ncbi:MAG: 4Fe-4S binding protein [Planctomycetota bacterium]|jgi:ferredoxin
MSRRGWLLLGSFVAAAACLLVALEVDLPYFESQNTYGNFDVASDRAFVTWLLPGTEDTALLRNYRFGHGVHWTPIIALLIVFAVFLAIRAIGDLDVKLGIARWLTAWGAFVVARFGLLRVSGVAPVRRCSYGIFPFLNCQACEMASGGCPIGAFQHSLLSFRFPLLPLVVMVLTGLALGRWICGWLCPFGMLSDMFDRISRKTWKPRRAWASLKFVVLGLIVAVPLGMAAMGGSHFLPFCATLCPSGSVFGLLPFYATTGAGEFGRAFTPGHATALMTILFHTAILVGFIWLAVKISGRVFCRYLCPLGAFLGLFHRFSLIRVVHGGDECNDCGKCRDDCPMGIDLSDPGFLVQSQCVRCSRCVKLCPTGARRWVFGWGTEGSKELRVAPELALSSDASR